MAQQSPEATRESAPSLSSEQQLMLSILGRELSRDQLILPAVKKRGDIERLTADTVKTISDFLAQDINTLINISITGSKFIASYAQKNGVLGTHSNDKKRRIETSKLSLVRPFRQILKLLDDINVSLSEIEGLEIDERFARGEYNFTQRGESDKWEITILAATQERPDVKLVATEDKSDQRIWFHLEFGDTSDGAIEAAIAERKAKIEKERMEVLKRQFKKILTNIDSQGTSVVQFCHSLVFPNNEKIGDFVLIDLLQEASLYRMNTGDFFDIGGFRVNKADLIELINGSDLAIEDESEGNIYEISIGAWIIRFDFSDIDPDNKVAPIFLFKESIIKGWIQENSAKVDPVIHQVLSEGIKGENFTVDNLAEAVIYTLQAKLATGSIETDFRSQEVKNYIGNKISALMDRYRKSGKLAKDLLEETKGNEDE